jgi:hypothetical protein
LNVARKEPEIQAFSLKIAEVELLSNFRRLPPADQDAAIGAMRDYLGRLGRIPPKSGSGQAGDRQTEEA